MEPHTHGIHGGVNPRCVWLSTSLWARTGAFILMVSSPRPTLAEHVDWRKGQRDKWVENKQRQRGDLRSSTNSAISWLGESGRCCQWHKEEDWLHLGIHLFTHPLNKPFMGWPPTCVALCLWFGVWQWTSPSPRDGVARVPFTTFFLPRCTACGILVPRPGIEPGPLAVRAWSPNHWTARVFPGFPLLLMARFSHTNYWSGICPVVGFKMTCWKCRSMLEI